MKNQNVTGEVVMRQKADGQRRSRKDLSLIVEERLSKLEFEENERLLTGGDQDAPPAIPVTSPRIESRIPVLKPTPVKGILKHSKGQQTITSAAPNHVSEHNKVASPTQISQQQASCQNQRPAQREMAAADEQSSESGLKYLEQTIREADQAVQQSMSVDKGVEEDYTGMHCVDIDIGEPATADSFSKSSNSGGGDKRQFESNVSSSSPRQLGHHDNPIVEKVLKRDNLDGAFSSVKRQETDQFVSAKSSSQSLSVNNVDSGLDVMSRSLPCEAFSRHTPNSVPSPTGTPDHKLLSSGYQVWTSNTLPLHSPVESPKHRLSQSGSPISPASGHQTIVYVPIVTNSCKCCSEGHRTDPLRELVSRRRRSSTRDDDQMSMASSIDSEIARYLVDYRGEHNSNIDVLESRNSLSLRREDKIQHALLVKLLLFVFTCVILYMYLKFS